jgi:hypothetical protein
MNDKANDVKIQLTNGPLTVDYEGPLDFLDDGLLTIVEEFVGITKDVAPPASPSTHNTKAITGNGSNGALQMTTGTIAGRLSVKTGPELIMASAAKLTLADGKDTFTRRDVLLEMKSAPSYYKESYRKNMSSLLDGLIKGDQIREISPSTYAVEATTKEKLTQQLGG